MDFSLRGQPLRLIHLLQLASSGVADPQKVLEKSFEWEHARRLEIAKWLLAISSGLAAVIAAAFLSRQSTDGWKLLGISATIWLPAASGVSGISGMLVFTRARAMHRRFVVISNLLADVMELRPFLQKLRRDGLL